jgi:hypothetical protein
MDWNCETKIEKIITNKIGIPIETNKKRERN